MPKVTLDVPEKVVVLLKALEARLQEIEADKTGAAKVVTEAEVDAVTSNLGLEYKRRSLQALDIDARGILVDGKPHARVGRYEATYFAKEGPVTVTRSLYRERGVRNAKTVDTVGLRSGAAGYLCGRPYFVTEGRAGVSSGPGRFETHFVTVWAADRGSCARREAQ